MNFSSSEDDLPDLPSSFSSMDLKRPLLRSDSFSSLDTLEIISEDSQDLPDLPSFDYFASSVNSSSIEMNNDVPVLLFSMTNHSEDMHSSDEFVHSNCNVDMRSLPRPCHTTFLNAPNADDELPPYFTGDRMSSLTYPVYPSKYVVAPSLSLDKEILQNFEYYSSSTLDIDYFAISISVSNLLLLGPMINLTSSSYCKTIQDPVFHGFQFGNILSMNPILCFDDLDSSFPLRSKFISILNQLGPLPMTESGSKKKGGMVFKDHWIPTALVMEALHECGVNFLRYSLYGTKIPVKKLKENATLLFLMDQCPSESSFYDVAVSVYHEDIIAVTLDSIPPTLPKLKKYPYFGYLFNGTVGGFSFSVEKSFDFKFYSLLYHHLMSNSKMEWFVPRLKMQLISKRDVLAGLLNRLKSSNLNLGGYRAEIRYYKSNLWDSLSHFEDLLLSDWDHLNCFLNSVVPVSEEHHSNLYCQSIPVNDYLLYVESIFDMACNNPSFSGVLGGCLFMGDHCKMLDEEEREMTEILFNSFGYYSDHYRRLHTSPDLINVWIGYDDLGVDNNGNEHSDAKKIILAAQKIHGIHLVSTSHEASSDIISQAALALNCDVDLFKDLFGNLKFYHPHQNLEKFQARKSNGAVTKAFLSKLELVCYLVSDMNSKGQLLSQWRQYFIPLLDSCAPATVNHPPDEHYSDDVMEEDSDSSSESSGDNEESSDVFEIILEDMRQNLFWVHPLHDHSKFMAALGSCRRHFHADVGCYDSLDELCVSIIRHLKENGKDPVNWRDFYSHHQ